MSGEVAGEVLVALDATAANPAEGPSWIKVTPRGKVRTRTGGNYEFDPDALEARYSADKVHVPVDLDHAIARLASQGHTVAAIGWIEELEARTDGLYGRVEWLDAGKAALAARSHRYVSPTFHHDGGKATWLHSVALVTAPDLGNMPAIASASTDAGAPALSPAILAALNLKADALDGDVLEAITTLKAGAIVGLSADGREVKELLADLAAARTEHQSRRISDKVEDAISRGIFPPYLKGWALATCAADEAGFDGLLKHIGTPLAHLFKETPQIAGLAARPSRFESAANEGEAAKLAAQPGIDPKSLKESR